MGDHVYEGWNYSDSSKHQRECSECKNVETESHSWNGGSVTKQPTCKETGVKTYTCTVCGGTKTESIPKTDNHTYGKWSNANASSHIHSCILCGKSETQSHSWNAGSVTKQPTCKETGVRTYTCTSCGGTKNETIAKTDIHSYGDGLFVDNNTHEVTCSLCEKTKIEDHRWDNGKIIEAPTLDKTGMKAYTCISCGTTKTSIVPKLADGDLDKNGKIDNKDVEYLLWNTLFPSKYPIDTFADFNNDGDVNNKDVEYLLWHTLFPEKYPLQVK